MKTEHVWLLVGSAWVSNRRNNVSLAQSSTLEVVPSVIVHLSPVSFSPGRFWLGMRWYVVGRARLCLAAEYGLYYSISEASCIFRTTYALFHRKGRHAALGCMNHFGCLTDNFWG